MDKVYIITNGEYSDYRIIAATLDKDVAEDIAEKTESNIEEYVLNTITNKKLTWLVHFYKRNDNKEDWLCLGPMPNLNNVKVGVVHESSLVGINKYVLYVAILAETKERALKIASDKIAQYRYEKGFV